MSQKTLRFILFSAAMVFTVNLLLFYYSQELILPFLGAVLLLMAIIGLGLGIVRAMQIAAAGIFETAALGLMATTAYFYLVSFARILNPLTIGVYFVVSVFFFAGQFFKERRRETLARFNCFFNRPLVEYAVFLVPLLFAALPPSFYDSLVYHLGIPNLYLQNNGFVPTPQLVYANTFIYYEISLIPAVFLGDLVPRLFHFLLGMFFVLAVADEAVECWGIKKKLNLILAIVSLPMTLFLLATSKNDLIGAVFIFLAIKQYQRENWKLTAVFWGFAIGIKYFNVLPLALFLLLTINPFKKADFKKLAFMILVIVLAVSPLLIKNIRFCANPFFPFLTDIFPSALWDSGRFVLLQADVGQAVRTPMDMVSWPYALSFFNYGYGGLVGPLFLIFLPFLLLAPVQRKKWLLWALLVLAVAPLLTASLRFVYIVFVFLAIFSVQAFEFAGNKLLKFIFYLLIAVNFFMGFGLLEKFYCSHYVWSGKFTNEQYKEHFCSSYPAFAYINTHAPAGAKILVAGEARGYYLKRPYLLSSALDYSILNKYLAESCNVAEFIAAIKKDGFAYLLVNFQELRRLQQKYFNMAAADERKLDFFLRSLLPEFSRGPVYLYKII